MLSPWGTQTHERMCPGVPGHSPKGHCPEKLSGKLTWECYSRSPALWTRWDPCARDTQTAKTALAPKQVWQTGMTGREKSGAAVAHSGVQSWLWLADSGFLPCSLPTCWNTPPIQPTAQKHTLMGALTSTNSCLWCLTWWDKAKVTLKRFLWHLFFPVK